MYATPPTIKVIVSDEVKAFYFRPNSIVSNFDYSERNLQESPLEATTRELQLPDVDVIVFKYFVKFLESGTIRLFLRQGHYTSIVDDMVKVWAFEERIGYDELQNVAIDEIGQYIVSIPYTTSQ
jgi:hypothetical protein